MPPNEQTNTLGAGSSKGASRPSATSNIGTPPVVAESLSRQLGSIRPQVMPSTGTRGIGNTAVLPPGTTRTGVPRMTFQPFNPMRRKLPSLMRSSTQDMDDKQPDVPAQGQETLPRGRGRGRGEGGPSGRGRGKGEVAMVASGPFAMGPAASGSSTSFRRMGESFTPTGLGASRISTPQSSASGEVSKKYDQGLDDSDGDSETFEEDGGEQKVDMRHVQRLDWSAPVALKQTASDKRAIRPKKELKVKIEDSTSLGHDLITSEPPESEPMVDASEARELANALDLSESEEEEEDEEDIMRHFTRRHLARQTTDTEKLYFFQFPSPFPAFAPSLDVVIDVNASGQDESIHSSSTDAKQIKGKAVSWAPGVKPEDEDIKSSRKLTGGKNKSSSEIDGVIGQMEIYENGEVKIRLGEGALMTVKAATPISFLQQAVEVDIARGRMNALGQISRKFIVQPDIQALLDELSGVTVDGLKTEPGLEGLEAMDTD
ncbi:hypothetical protein FRB97_009388 [Tulasnella sp. 331]|nr:hypothetical protein FRB97_009388 [Tulasnella sp. 331]KAG8887543.1 hypothetical protein FRB98_009449 [Tulasnella sp. 332]